mmetsp:Transcript_1604/g.5050  ORF Transcript_1604/g.5050 Transcript_1604/m.5050 type:complete len:188 (+) Transcript_1604:473-1036(+)
MPILRGTKMMGGSRAVLLLDGGFGHELKERGFSGSEATSTSSTFLAGALANQNDPSAVVGLHREYIRAGCDVLTTNSFVLTPHHLAKAGLGRTHLQDLVEMGGERSGSEGNGGRDERDGTHRWVPASAGGVLRRRRLRRSPPGALRDLRRDPCLPEWSRHRARGDDWPLVRGPGLLGRHLLLPRRAP